MTFLENTIVLKTEEMRDWIENKCTSAEILKTMTINKTDVNGEKITRIVPWIATIHNDSEYLVFLLKFK